MNEAKSPDSVTGIPGLVLRWRLLSPTGGQQDLPVKEAF